MAAAADCNLVLFGSVHSPRRLGWCSQRRWFGLQAVADLLWDENVTRLVTAET